MTAFDQAFAKTYGVEGDYSNDQNDAGRATRYGVTEAVARAHGYTGDMRALPLATAKAIMKSAYWDVLRLDAIAGRSQVIAEELYDTGVNQGVGMAGRFLQRALNVFNRGGRDYTDITIDGVVGPMTVFVFGKYLDRRGKKGEAVMLRALNALQGARYIEITEAKPTLEDFTFGWFLQRVS